MRKPRYYRVEMLLSTELTEVELDEVAEHAVLLVEREPETRVHDLVVYEVCHFHPQQR